MTDTNPRDLIQRMAEELDRHRYIATDDRRSTHPLSDEARAYLAQSEPDDSSAFIAWILFDPDGKLRPEAQEVLAARGIAQPEPEELTDGKLEELADDYMVMDGSNGTMHLERLDFARAAMAADRAFCARPAIKPVPVSERLPGPEDCDTEGRCWHCYPAFTYFYLVNGEHDTTNPEWDLEPLPSHEPDWSNLYWLPHWALPVPTK